MFCRGRVSRPDVVGADSISARVVWGNILYGISEARVKVSSTFSKVAVSKGRAFGRRAHAAKLPKLAPAGAALEALCKVEFCSGKLQKKDAL